MKRHLSLFLCLIPLFAMAQQNKDLRLSEIFSSLSDRIAVGAFLQGGYDYDSQAETSSFYQKRATVTLKGQITDHWTAFFAFEFANSTTQELWMEYKVADELTFRAGQFKTMFGLENMTSPTDVELIDDAAQSTLYLMAQKGDVLQGNHAGRDIGIMASGDLLNKIIHYDLSLMNGQGINRRDANKAKDFVARVIVNVTPALALSGSYYDGKGHALADNASMGIAQGQDYNRDRWALGAKFSIPRINLRGEYLGGKDADIKSEGWYALGTFEVVKNLDLILSYDFFNKNKAINDKQTNYVGGLQWWFFKGCRLRATYTYRDSNLLGESSLIQTAFQIKF